MSIWDKLKKLGTAIVGDGSAQRARAKKKKEDAIKRDKKGYSGHLGRGKDKVSKDSDIYMKAKVRKGSHLDMYTKKKDIKDLGHHEVYTDYEPAKKETKGGTYYKYGKDTKTAESFRDAFAGARKSWKAGKGGDTFEWKGKKFSVQTADDKKRKAKFKKILPHMKGM